MGIQQQPQDRNGEGHSAPPLGLATVFGIEPEEVEDVDYAAPVGIGIV